MSAPRQSETPETSRIACCVPHCRRTARIDAANIEWPDNVWICAKHWAAAPKSMKAVKRRLRRALNADPFNGALVRRFVRISKRITREAIERGLEI